MTTDRQRIVTWAEQREAVPVRTDPPDGEVPLDVVPDPAGTPGEEIPWQEFFERFELEGAVFRYREAAGAEGDGRACEVVRRKSLDDREAVDGKTEAPDEVESEPIAASDTGEGEPVIFDRVEEEDGNAAEDVPDRGTGGTPGPKVDAEQWTEDGDEGDTAMSESARSAEEPAIVLDEVYEDPAGLDSDPDAEYVVFENAGEEPVDLGGWTVENDGGRSYVFPAEFTLDGGDRVTLHGGRGRDTDADLHWGADESVWDPTGDTVELRTPAGDRVIYEPIKGG